MSDLSQVTDNMLPVSSETFESTLAQSISAGDDTVPILSLDDYTEGDSVVLVVDAGTDAQATFVGEKQGNSVINVKWTEGNTEVSHDSGAPVVDYVSATHYNLVTKLLRQIATQDGKLLTSAVQAALNINTAVPPDFTALANQADVSAVHGNNLYDLQFNSADYRDRLAKGMVLRIPRSGDVPTQSADFSGVKNSSRAAGSVAGFTFTDDFTIEGWVYVNAYPTISSGAILTRLSTNGFVFGINSTGQLRMYVRASGLTADIALSDISIPIGKWVHVAGRMNASASSCVFLINGAPVATTYATNGTSTGLTQAGDLVLGAETAAGTAPFNGLISDVRLWASLRTDDEIQDNMNQYVPSDSTNLVGNWKLNNSWEDSTVNANHLTPNGGALATFESNPFKAIEWAKIVGTPTVVDGNTVVKVWSGAYSNIPSQSLEGISYTSNVRAVGVTEDLRESEIIIRNDAAVALKTGIASIDQSRTKIMRKGNVLFFTTYFTTGATLADSAVSLFGIDLPSFGINSLPVTGIMAHTDGGNAVLFPHIFAGGTIDNGDTQPATSVAAGSTGFMTGFIVTEDLTF